MAAQNAFCPVCGYDLKLACLDDIVDKCPSCSFDFSDLFGRKKQPYNRFEPKDLGVRIYRGKWMDARMPWCDKNTLQPENWDPVKQMQTIGINLGSSFWEWSENNPVVSPENNRKFLQLALQKIKNLDWQPQVIEVLWDGDTQGWWLHIFVSMPDSAKDKAYKSYTLFRLRGQDGDLRAFNGQVPPWPEAQIGAFVGEEISKQLGIPLNFPSPEQPNDEYASWWERDEQRRCKSCGRYLAEYSQPSDSCWLCERGS